MAKRKSVLIRVDASEVQGEGAFLSLRKYTWDERKALRDKMAAIPTEDIKVYVRQMTDLLEEEIRARLVEWNFVDSNDQPIPLGDIGALIDGESNFVFGKMQELIKQALGTDEAAKN